MKFSFLKQKGRQVVTKVTNLFCNLQLPDPLLKNINKLIHTGYRILLRREPDEEGLLHYKKLLGSGEISPQAFFEDLMSSDEFRGKLYFENHLFSLHYSRCQFIHMLPKASRILDLGGSSQHDDRGALVCMGYPYKFEELIIVDLPSDDSHPIYSSKKDLDVVQSALGAIRYNYHSMTDLSRYPDASFDMVVSGQSIEHITEEEGGHLIGEAFRVLKPGGYFCLDTPNGPACRLHVKGFISEDHKIEYSHEQLSEKIRQAGFEICDAWGLNYMGESFRNKVFSREEVSKNIGVFAEIEHCYLLAYICQKPEK
ncbi:MAG: methyltransferase domain-containing protein [Candidatus Aminicenantes bacterium]|nr:MAG: methyltransferase domain-containing protein [Candidatus Aminicenantes bacterium]